MKNSYFYVFSNVLTDQTRCLAYHPESIPTLAHPPTPSATSMIFLDTKMASSPPFQTFWGCGAKAKASLKWYFFLFISTSGENIFLRLSLELFMGVQFNLNSYLNLRPCIDLQQMEEEEQRDEWLDEVQQSNTLSLFDKQVIQFSNEMIEENVNKRMEMPVLNEQFDEEEREKVLDDHEEKQTEVTFSEKADRKVQALFNPLEDQENQKWVKKYNRQGKRALTCPSCFTQIAFNYQVRQTKQKDIQYIATQVFGVEVQERKIIRQAEQPQIMQWSGVASEKAEKELREREQAFNIKILVDCSCGLTVGYFDVNKEGYVLTNVI